MTSPDWMQPHRFTTPAQAPKDLSYWRDQVLPHAEDRNHHTYVVIPTQGLVAPIILPEDQTSADRETMLNGQEGDMM